MAAHPGALSNSNPLTNVKVNCLGSMNVINWCFKNKAKLIFTSSSAVYGSQSSKRINEDFPTKPETIYAANKIVVENWLKILSRVNNFNWTVYRLFPTYGFGHSHNTYQGVVNVFLTQILKSRKIISKGSLNRERDLIYCIDVATAIINNLSNQKTNQTIINLGSGTSTKIIDIIYSIIEIYGYTKKNYDIIEEEGFFNDPMFSISDPSLSKKLINFKTHYNLIEGLEDMFKRRQE